MKILFKNARILKMDDSPIFVGELVVENDRIVYIGNDGSSFAPFDYIRECDGNVIMPSFKNAHAHSAMTFVRSKTDDCSLQTWLFDVVFPRENFLTPDAVYHLTKVAILEYMTSGITACFDQYFFPPAIAKASEDLGFRTTLLGVFSNTHENCEGNGAEYMYHLFNEPKESLVRYIVGLHAEYTTSDEDFKITAKLINETKSPFYTHACETFKEVEECKQRHNGLSPIEVIESYYLYKNGGGAFHCVYLNDKEIEILKKHNCYVVTCPGSNTKLASGIAPIKKYVDAGLNVAIGTDGPASNNCLDMFKEMTLVSSLSKVSTKDPSSLDAYTILKMATVNGARALGLFDCDTLNVGKKADIIEIDLKRPNMQPINNIVNNIVYAGSKDNIKLTMINGKIVYRDREFFVGENIDSIYANATKTSDEIERKLQESIK